MFPRALNFAGAHGHLVRQPDIAAHQKETSPVGRMGKVLCVLHRLHGFRQGAKSDDKTWI